MQASRRGAFPCCKAWALEREVSSGGARAYLLHGMRDLGSQISDWGQSLELTGGLLNTGPPGTSRMSLTSDLNSEVFVIRASTGGKVVCNTD